MTTREPAAIPEATVAAVVSEISERMKNPKFAELAVGDFVQSHPDAGRFVTAQAKALGGSEAVVHVIFHAQVIAECFRKHGRTRIRPVSFAALDRAAGENRLAALSQVEPALADYIGSNVEAPAEREAIAHISLAIRDLSFPG